jgi:hypothetical protein
MDSDSSVFKGKFLHRIYFVIGCPLAFCIFNRGHTSSELAKLINEGETN